MTPRDPSAPSKPFVEKRTSSQPFVVDGVRFACWHVGICKYETRSDDGRIIVWAGWNGADRASVDGETLRDKRGRVRGFKDRTAAIRAALKAMPAPQVKP